MADPFAYDPEKALWKPNRRGFLSLFGCAVAAAFVPDLPIAKDLGISGWGQDATLRVGDTFTIAGVYVENPWIGLAAANARMFNPKLKEFKVTGVHGGVLTIAPSVLAASGKWGKTNG